MADIEIMLRTARDLLDAEVRGPASVIEFVWRDDRRNGTD